MNIFPAHYSETAIAVLSLPGWTKAVQSLPNMHDIYDHDNGTEAYVWTDGTISTYPDTADDDVIAGYMTADPIFRD